MKGMKLTLLATLLLSAMGANANVVSGTALTDGGKAVNLQSMDWLSLAATRNISAVTMLANLEDENGWVDSLGNSWGYGEWRLATRHEAEELLYSVWGGTVVDGVSKDNYDGASWFSDNFGMTASNSPQSALAWFNYGIGECGDVDAVAYSEAERGCQGKVFVDFVGQSRDSLGNVVNPDGSTSRQITYKANSGPAAAFYSSGGVNFNQSYDVRINNSTFGLNDNVARNAESFLLVRGQEENYGGWGEPGAAASNVSMLGGGIMSMGMLGFSLAMRRRKK
jgi:hypothetical protein